MSRQSQFGGIFILVGSLQVMHNSLKKSHIAHFLIASHYSAKTKI